MNVLARFKPVTTFMFDMDGVLTDGNLLLTEDGAWLRTMNTKDGFALQLAIREGFNIVVISGSNCKPVEQRLLKLGIKEVYQNVKQKEKFLQDYILQHKIDPQNLLFMGDDVPDHAAMKLSGLPCCPADAVNDIKEISDYISPFAGGKGCVRDVIEKVLKLNDKWNLQSNLAST